MLVVCTGNICRSPAAELLLRAGLGDADVHVASAGLAARTGEPVAPPMARLLAARGVDTRGFRARQLQPAEDRSAGLVLTMTAEQRSAVVTRAPASVRRVFTLREFAELAHLVADLPGRSSPAGRLAALVAAAPRARALRDGVREDDVEDPYGLPDEVFARSLDLVDTAVRTLVAALEPGAVRSA